MFVFTVLVEETFSVDSKTLVPNSTSGFRPIRSVPRTGLDVELWTRGECHLKTDGPRMSQVSTKKVTLAQNIKVTFRN